MKIPSYIPISLIRNAPREYSWDDWDPYEIIGEPEDEAEIHLEPLSDRALIAFSIACAEWVIYRFNELEEDATPYMYIDSFWAFEISDRIMAPPETNPKEWQGAVRMAADIALMNILNAITQSVDEDEAPVYDAAFAERLALHVLHDTKPFLKWKKAILPRLKLFFPKTERNRYGQPVPRQAFDPSIELTASMIPDLAEQFLENIDVNSNDFIQFWR